MLARFADAAAVEAEIERVQALSGVFLRRRWQAVFGQTPPACLTPDLLRRMIAHRLQEEAFGTLDRETLSLLDALARRESSRSGERRNLKPGTVLVREHAGKRHMVTVERDGFAWNGQSYSSLSAIARAITGTAGSGPRFFGLNRERTSKVLGLPAAKRRRPHRQSSSRSETAAPHVSSP